MKDKVKKFILKDPGLTIILLVILYMFIDIAFHVGELPDTDPFTVWDCFVVYSLLIFVFAAGALTERAVRDLK